MPPVTALKSGKPTHQVIVGHRIIFAEKLAKLKGFVEIFQILKSWPMGLTGCQKKHSIEYALDKKMCGKFTQELKQIQLMSIFTNIGYCPPKADG